MAEAEGSAPAEVSSSGSGPSGLIVLILTGVNTLLTLGLIGMMYLDHQKSKEVTLDDIEHAGEKTDSVTEGLEGTPTAQQYGKILELKQFQVNLSPVGSSVQKFARVQISLELPSEDTKTEVEQKMAQVRNTIIDLFNAQRPDDLLKPEGRNYVKEQIRKAINSFLVTGKVTQVFFTNFAVSS